MGFSLQIGENASQKQRNKIYRTISPNNIFWSLLLRVFFYKWFNFLYGFRAEKDGMMEIIKLYPILRIVPHHVFIGWIERQSLPIEQTCTHLATGSGNRKQNGTQQYSFSGPVLRPYKWCEQICLVASHIFPNIKVT